MMRKAQALLLALLTASVILAGCTDKGEVQDDRVVEGKVTETEFQLKAGKGAIAGLLVDDRFRPIHLTDDPKTEFDATGFVLLQELGLQSKTDANGQFSFVDLDPGTYTLRVSAAGHETTPQKIRVDEGLFNEISLLARRVSSVGSYIVTEEYSFFAPCAASVIATTAIFGCFDASGDNWRPGPSLNYTGVTNATFMVIEYLTDSAGKYLLQVRGDSVYCNIYTEGGRYGKAVFMVSEEEVYDAQCANPWPNTGRFEAIGFYGGAVDNPAEGSGAPAISGRNGLGAVTSTAAKIIISVFVGEPDVDVDAYQILTEDST